MMKVEIVSAEEEIYSGTAEMVLLRLLRGKLGWPQAMLLS